MQGREGVGKHVIRNAPALGNPFALVECPVDAEVDSALAVFLFGFRERIKAARLERPHDAVGTLRHTIVLVRNERELNIVVTEKFSQDLKESAPKTGMAFDAVVAINRGYRSYTGIAPAPKDTSMDAAVAQAAHDTLSALFRSYLTLSVVICIEDP